MDGVLLLDVLFVGPLQQMSRGRLILGRGRRLDLGLSRRRPDPNRPAPSNPCAWSTSSLASETLILLGARLPAAATIDHQRQAYGTTTWLL